MFGARLVDAAAIWTVDSGAQAFNCAVSLALDGFDVANAAMLFRFVKLRTADAFGSDIKYSAVRANQNRRFSARYRDHLPIQIGVYVGECGRVLHLWLAVSVNQSYAKQAATTDMGVIAMGFTLRFLESGYPFAFGGALNGMRCVFYCALQPVFWFVCHILSLNRQRRVPWLSMRLWCAAFGGDTDELRPAFRP